MPAAVIQALIPNLTQTGDGDGADVPALALEVGQDPSSLSLLNGPNVKFGQLVAPEGAADPEAPGSRSRASLLNLTGRARRATPWPAQGSDSLLSRSLSQRSSNFKEAECRLPASPWAP
jgi:hypothetical protein